MKRSDIAAYVEHEQERGFKINSVRNHLHTLYAFLRYLTNNDVLSADILQKKIRIKLPEVLPRAIPVEDLQQILQAITSIRDRALILLLLHTGMRIGELLRVSCRKSFRRSERYYCTWGRKIYTARLFTPAVLPSRPSRNG
jgi:site-specific recombinase XerD